MIEKVLRSGKLSEAVVFLERDIKDRAETTSMENVRLRHVIIGILPYVKITKHNLDVASVKHASWCTEMTACRFRHDEK